MNRRSFLISGSFLIIASCAQPGGPNQSTDTQNASARAPNAIQPGPDPFGWPIVSRSGQRVGTVTTRRENTGVRVTVDLAGVPPGEHGVHIHQTAKCEGPTFESAGGHWNWTKKKHGHRNPKGHHAGDLGNLTVSPDGRVQHSFFVTSKDWDPEARGGWPIVIHDKPDDEKTDPSGNSGDRIACGVLFLRKD